MLADQFDALGVTAFPIESRDRFVLGDTKPRHIDVRRDQSENTPTAGLRLVEGGSEQLS